MTNGATGPLPEYYIQIKAAKFLGVPVWDLIERPRYWSMAAFVVMQADNEAEAKQRQKQERRNNKK